MTDNKDLFFLCRNCLQFEKNVGSSCNRCETNRITAHPELFTLSIAHLDCDAFYAAIEKRDNPSLQDQPVIVGGGKRGVVSTCCYIARTFGVHSAMPMFKALKACPDAVIIKPDFAKYSKAAHQIREMMISLTPLVEPLSIDEAFLDLTGTRRVHGVPPALAMARLQNRIAEDIGVTVSIGLSHNKFLAKIASDFDKPNGFFVIGKEETSAFLSRQPISIIWGIGAKTTARFARDGLRTIDQIQKMEPKDLVERYGETGLRLSKLAHGLDERPVKANRTTKSVSAETTFNEDISEYDQLVDNLWPLCEKVSKRMKLKNFSGRVLTLKLKTSQFKTITRQLTLEEPSNLARIAFDHGRDLLKAECDGRQFRLIGIGYSDLLPADAPIPQSDFFATTDKRLKKREAVVDQLRNKFGDNVINAARILKRK